MRGWGLPPGDSVMGVQRRCRAIESPSTAIMSAMSAGSVSIGDMGITMGLVEQRLVVLEEESCWVVTVEAGDLLVTPGRRVLLPR